VARTVLALATLVADVGRSAALADSWTTDAVTPLFPGSAGGPAIAAFGKLEAERAADWIGLGEAELKALAHSVAFPRLVAD
jgi:hypothetical protein